jgi:hypothetical protein
MTEPKWANYDDEALLKVRICDLKLGTIGTELESHINHLYDELNAKGLAFKPPCYLADEWLCPDEEPIIGIPFFLAHPRLKKLEKKMVLEVEGETKKEFMKLLRHEAGHAFNYAYRLYKRRKWTQVFGSFAEEYPDSYIPRPYSKKFVRHIENNYAQYHPDEDFAETFAVWLAPNRDWHKEYKRWKVAHAKLTYVDEVMKSVAGKLPVMTSNKKYWSADRLTQTLGYYYKKKRREYAEDLPGFFNPDLKRIFRETSSEAPENAVKFLRRHRKNIVAGVSMWTGKNKYLINKILKGLIDDVSELGLQRYVNEEAALLNITTYINTLVMNYLFTGRLKP